MASRATPPAAPAPYDPRPHAAAIPRPVAVVTLATAELALAHVALASFERRRFPPDTPANNMYQMFVDTSWNDAVLAVTVFPEAALPELDALVRACQMSLLSGAPHAVVGGAVSRYDVNASLRRVLGIEVGDRTYAIQRSPDYFVPNLVGTTR